jgi:hypothetical protein
MASQARQTINDVAAKAGGGSPVRAGPNLVVSQRRPTVTMGDRPGEMRWLLLALAAAAGMAWLALAG